MRIDCKTMEESSNLVKTPMKSSFRTGQPERKMSTSSNSLNTTANNTNPIVCAVCGSKEYITLHSQDKGNYAFGLSSGWNSPELLKKNSLFSEFAQTCGPLGPMGQAFFPHLSLFHFPSNLYYSYYNSQLRCPPCVPIDKYFGDSSTELDASKAATINSESTIYRENRETNKKKKSARVNNDCLRKEGANGKEESRPTSAFTSLSEVRNFPLAMHPPWMGNICPIFPYTYTSLAFPVNQPLFPIYFPVPGKWQNDETPNEEDTVCSSASNSPVGDGVSIKNEGEKKSEEKVENNSAEYDFEVFARELVLEHDEDEEEEVEINLDEITSSLELPGINSGIEINSEKFFNSKEKWSDSRKDGSQEKDSARNRRLSSEVNTQDCCIRTLSNENFWYEAQEGEKKNWNSLQEYYSKDSGFMSSCKRNDSEVNSVLGKDKIGDGFYETKTVWTQERNRIPDELESKGHANWKNNIDNNLKRHKVTFGESTDETSNSSDERNEWSKTSKTELNDEVEIRLSEDKVSSSADSARLRDLKGIGDEASKLDMRYNDFTEDTEGLTQIPNRSETQQQREDSYSVRLNSVQTKCSRSIFQAIRSQRNENVTKSEKNEKTHDLQDKNEVRHTLKLNWDKINDILEQYNEKFNEVCVVLKHKQALGEKMIEAVSGKK